MAKPVIEYPVVLKDGYLEPKLMSELTAGVKQVAGGLGANQLPPVVASGGISNTANVIPQQPLAPYPGPAGPSGPRAAERG